ncbi:hypothetical protein U1Q18_050854, partial [Sarracenia purpurea var. burkii]
MASSRALSWPRADTYSMCVECVEEFQRSSVRMYIPHLDVVRVEQARPPMCAPCPYTTFDHLHNARTDRTSDRAP